MDINKINKANSGTVGSKTVLIKETKHQKEENRYF